MPAELLSKTKKKGRNFFTFFTWIFFVLILFFLVQAVCKQVTK